MAAETSLLPAGLPPDGLADLQQRLVRLLGAEAVVAGDRLGEYQVDGRAPRLVVRPGTPDDVAASLAVADELGAAVVPWGGGTARALGLPPRTFDLALDLWRLDRVLQYEPADLTLSAQAGITFGALDRVLAEHGQRLPLDCGHPAHSTLGGQVAANLSGPRRLRYGTARDALIGIGAALTDGTLARGGGRVVKNVSGYDMMKLYLGSLGTLGVLVELNFKVAPRPASQVVLWVAFADAAPALAAAEALLGSALLPTAVVLLDPVLADTLELGLAPAWTLGVGFEGAALPTARQAREIRERAGAWHGEVVAESAGEAAEDLWQRLARFGWPGASDGNAALLKIAVLPSEVGVVLEALAAVCAQVQIAPHVLADAASGIVHAHVAAADEVRPDVFAWALGTLQRELVRRFGSSVVLSCPAGAKADLPLWGREPAGLGVMRAIKEQFDPRATLNPGRFVGGI